MYYMLDAIPSALQVTVHSILLTLKEVGTMIIPISEFRDVINNLPI